MDQTYFSSIKYVVECCRYGHSRESLSTAPGPCKHAISGDSCFYYHRGFMVVIFIHQHITLFIIRGSGEGGKLLFHRHTSMLREVALPFYLLNVAPHVLH